MKFTLPLAILAVLVTAKPQGPPPPPGSAPAPPVSVPPQQPPPVPVPSTKTVLSPVPAPSNPAPAPVPGPPSSASAPAPPGPTTSGEPDGAICECGYTYCASVLMTMKKPWTEKQLAAAYCSTSRVNCQNGNPNTNVTAALYICLCEDDADDYGTDLDLICGCDNCLVVAPDFRGRCETPCYSDGSCNMGGEAGRTGRNVLQLDYS